MGWSTEQAEAGTQGGEAGAGTEAAGSGARSGEQPRPPVALSPSRASDFMQCPLLYRFRVIDRLPEKPNPAATRGTVVHAVLERLFDAPAAERTAVGARAMVPGEWEKLLAKRPELAELFADDVAGERLAQWLAQAEALVERWFSLEDPTRLEPAERELYVETVLDSGLQLRGFIDRVDVAPTGEVRIVDYKTGKAPRPQFAEGALFQMKFYALVMWRLRGVVPRRLQLVYLGSGDVVTYDPSEADLRAVERKLLALWEAIRLATETGDWRPRPTKLCGWCDHQAHCPEFGGTPRCIRCRSARRRAVGCRRAEWGTSSAVALPGAVRPDRPIKGELVAIRVLLVDDQPLLRTGFRMILEAEQDLAVVGEAGDGLQALEQVRALQPDVVLMDIRMPRMDGVEATRQITGPAKDGPAKVLVLTTFDLDEYVVEALRAGASGFLLKDAPAHELVQAIRVVAGGEAMLAPSITRRLLDKYAGHLPSGEEPVPDTLHTLTEREVEVLKLVARGLSNAEIAADLFVSETTVKTHVGHVLTKLGLRDRVQAAVYAYESGLVRPGAQ